MPTSIKVDGIFTTNLLFCWSHLYTYERNAGDDTWDVRRKYHWWATTKRKNISELKMILPMPEHLSHTKVIVEMGFKSRGWGWLKEGLGRASSMPGGRENMSERAQWGGWFWACLTEWPMDFSYGRYRWEHQWARSFSMFFSFPPWLSRGSGTQGNRQREVRPAVRPCPVTVIPW